MTPLLQVTSRAHTIPLDVITTKTDMTQIVDSAEVEGQPDDGAYVHGWFLQGARWDVPSGTMKESILKVGEAIHPCIGTGCFHRAEGIAARLGKAEN